MTALDVYRRNYRWAIAAVWAGVGMIVVALGFWLFAGLEDLTAFVIGAVGFALMVAGAIMADEYAELHNREVWRREYNR